MEIKRIVYATVGAAAIYALGFMVISWESFWETMTWHSAVGYILLTIGGINWLIVALNKQGKDLFDYLKIR